VSDFDDRMLPIPGTSGLPRRFAPRDDGAVSDGGLTVEPGAEKAPIPFNDPASQVATPCRARRRGLYDARMACASCVAHVEKALKAAPGVVEARANLAGATVRAADWSRAKMGDS
jgi:hypothetical protein